MTIEQMLARKRELGYTYEMIAEKSGVPLGTVQKVLGGFTDSPRYETLRALENVLGSPEKGLPYPEQAELLRRRDNSYVREPSQAYAYRSEGMPDASPNTGYKDVPAVSIDDAKQGSCTVDDLEELPDDVRVELIDGVLYDLAALHAEQRDVALNICTQINHYIRKNRGSCRAMMSPVDVILDETRRTCVRPDVLILCHKEQLRKHRVYGPPDFVLEVRTGSAVGCDETVKLVKYKRSGVREYWIVDYENGIIVTFFYETNTFGIYGMTDKVPVRIYGGDLLIDFNEINASLDFFR